MSEPTQRQRASHTKLWVALALGVVFLLSARFLPLGGWLRSLAESMRGAGAWGVALYVLVYVVGALLLVPGSLLTLVAGFAYGPLYGTLLVWPTATLAAVLGFLSGRFVAGDWVRRRTRDDGRFAAVERVVARQGFRVVLLLRLSPLFPFSLLNYALGLTRIRLWHYFVASALGMLPGSALYVYLGSLITNASQLARGEIPDSPYKTWLYWGGLGATLLLTLWLTRLARRELGASLADAGPAVGRDSKP